MTYIVNGCILTMEGEKIPSGFVGISGAKISKVGEMKAFPSGFSGDIFDAGGGYVIPGLIDAHTHIGMWEDSLGFEGDDGNEDTDPATPHLRAIDAVNPCDKCFEEARHGGVSAVMTGPGSANPIGGQMAFIKTAGMRIDSMVIRAPAAIKFALGENPKMVYHGKNQSPVTRMATAAIIRDMLCKTREYIKLKERAAADPDCDEPDFDIKLESLIPLVKGEIDAHFHAHRADDIFTAVRIAKEFGLKYALIHATEGHLIAGELAKEGARVISGPAFGFRAKPELRNMSRGSASSLIGADVVTAIATDHPEIPCHMLMYCASLAEREGISDEAALRAVTIVPAQILGAGDRMGSIKKGKDADIAVFTGHPFDRKTRLAELFIDGKRQIGVSGGRT